MRRALRIQKVYCLIAILMVAGAPAVAQEYRGRVQGIIGDASGAVIPGASLVLRNDATGVEVIRGSNPEGRYLFDYVDPGTYSKLTAFNFTVAQSGGSGNPAVTADPKHRFVTATTWEIPVGRGRKLGSNLSPAVDYVIGGWQLSGI